MAAAMKTAVADATARLHLGCDRVDHQGEEIAVATAEASASELTGSSS